MTTNRRRCWFKRCKRTLDVSEQRLTLVPHDDHRVVVALCEKHYRAMDTVTRMRFWNRHRRPKIYGAHSDSVKPDKVWAFYRHQGPGKLYVTQHFAELTPEQMVYVLTHETLHWWLGREFGTITSQSFDLFYHQPLNVLGGSTLHDWMAEALYTAMA